MSQNWPLSQLINKSSGTCSVCLATRQVHVRGGTIHKHGPRHDPCPGSNKPPLQAGSQTLVVSDQPASTSSASSLNCAPSDDVTQSSPIWTPSDSPVIKHIPKSARPSCASHLAALLRRVVSNPESTAKWLELFSWSSAVLRTPKQGGKRRNLASTIKHRIASFSVGQPDDDYTDPTLNARWQKSSSSTAM